MGFPKYTIFIVKYQFGFAHFTRITFDRQIILTF